MIKTLGNNIVSAFTGGNPVKAIYAYGEKVWPSSSDPTEYYIQWYPTSLPSYMQITVNSVRYSCKDYPSGYMSVSKYITYLVAPGSITSFYTNAYLENINSQAFAGCDSLVNVTIPQCLSIGQSAFRECNALQRIESSYFPSCGYVSYNAFYGCSNLSYVFLSKCSVIGSYAFNYCSYLDTVILPCCSQIMSGAFHNTAPSYTISGHPGLRSLYIGCGPGVGSDRFLGVCSIAYDAFGGRWYNSSFKIYVPSSTYSAYRREYSSTGGYSVASSLYSHFVGI